MTRFFCSLSVVMALVFTPWMQAEDFKLEEVSTKPEGIAAPILEKLSEKCFRVSGENGVVCEVWLVKEIAIKQDFKSTLTVKYPFTPGQLIGAIHLPQDGTETDFKGQEMPKGTFTLRYGQQPQDGNHLGTSDVSDFVLACVAEEDQTTDIVKNQMDLFKMSATAAGTTHPAIFLLVPPPAKPASSSQLEHNAEKELWILNTKVTDGKQPQAIRIVIFGHAEG